MSMTRVYFRDSGQDSLAVDCDSSRSLLEGLLAAGVAIPNSCRAGLCQACLCQAHGDLRLIDPEAQLGLTELQRRNNLLLACQAKPRQGLSIGMPTHRADWLCQLKQKRFLSSSVVELTFKAEGDWKPGQHLLLWRDDEHVRPYSASNLCSAERLIQFVIERHEHGVVSRWCYDELAEGSQVRLSPPQGNFCCDSELGAGLVVFAEGSGAGAAAGIILDAQALDETINSDLFFVHSGHSKCDSENFPSALFSPVSDCLGARIHLLEGEGVGGSAAYPLVRESLNRHCPNLRGKRVFIVGSESFVDEMSRACFFAGAARNDMVCETFWSQCAS